MPINLRKHAKIWIHPDGFIPEKIRKRLIFQKQIRPEDRLTVFINQRCLEQSKDCIRELKNHGILVKVIEDSISERIDDKFLVNFFQKVMEKVTETKNLRDIIYATNVLRLTKLVQKEGVYSDNDVLFLNFDSTPLIMKQYLFGCRAQGLPDIHILGIDLNYSDKFYSELIEKIKEICGDPPIIDDEVCAISGLALIPDSINLLAYGHLAFVCTTANVILGKDGILNENTVDSVLEEAKRALEEGCIKNRYKL